MANVTLVEHPRGLLGRLSFRYSKRMLGRVADPVRAANHHGGVLVASGLLETAVARGWRKLDPGLAGMVQLLAAARIGCTWCVDYGYYEQVHKGADPAKLRAVTQWRTSAVFDDRERAALEYTDCATATPVVVPDELTRRLQALFSEAEMVELASWVALENYRSRFNGAMGLHSEGFSKECALPILDEAGHIVTV